MALDDPNCMSMSVSGRDFPRIGVCQPYHTIPWGDVVLEILKAGYAGHPFPGTKLRLSIHLCLNRPNNGMIIACIPNKRVFDNINY